MVRFHNNQNRRRQESSPSSSPSDHNTGLLRPPFHEPSTSSASNPFAIHMSPSSTDSTATTTIGQRRSLLCASKKRSKHHQQMILRALFVISLVAAAVVCAVVSYFVIYNLELEIGKQNYESVAVTALESAKAITLRKIQVATVMKSILSHAFPNASQWPFVGLNGYSETSRQLGSYLSSRTTSMAMIVVVEPDQVEEFEAHAKQHFQSQGYPESAGSIPGLGFGVRRRDSTADSGYSFDHTGNVTVYPTNNTVLTPVLDHSTAGSRMLMYNVHVSSTAVDSILDCSRKAKQQAEAASAKTQEIFEDTSNEQVTLPDETNAPNCSIITGFKTNSINEDIVGLIYEPIYPQNDPTTVVGMVGLSVNFKDVLVSVVPEYFDGVTAVVSTHTQTNDHTTIEYDTVTYNIVDGKPRLAGEGDLHDRSFHRYGHSIVLNDFNTNAADAVIYTLTFYPSTFDQFQTKSPIAVSMGFVCVILISTFIFYLYDYLMRRESTHQKLVLDLKRRFVRFISHEIRTPLNTVCMGLELLKSDLRSHRSNETCDESSPDTSSSSSSHEVQQNEGESPSSISTASNPNSVLVDESSFKFWYEITNDVQENAASAVGILSDLLNYDKIESGTLRLEISTVDLLELVSKTVRKFKVQAVNKKIKLSLSMLSCPCHLFHEFTQPAEEMGTSVSASDKEIQKAKSRMDHIMLLGDEMRLSQVLCNLVSNALKFTPAGGSVQVTLEHRSPPNCTPPRPKEKQLSNIRCDCPARGSVVIYVKDTGAGMSADQLSLLFTEGVQFDANKLQAGGGSGLGLCISKGIIDRHDGFITAESDGKGQGSTFRVELPLYDFGEDDTSKHSVHEDDRLTETSSGPELVVNASSLKPPAKPSSLPPPPRKVNQNILVVEDVASSRKMLIRLLERAGHTCLPACNGQEAVDAVVANMELHNKTAGADAERDVEQGKPRPFDTILMDYEMPIMNGPDATERIRELGFRGLVFGVTGNVLGEDVDFFVSKGANQVVPKPVSMKSLTDAWERTASGSSRKVLAKASSSNGTDSFLSLGLGS